MNAHVVLFSSPVTPERLSWIEECLKFFLVQLSPETLVHAKAGENPVLTFFLTGDALYSLVDPETLQIWNIILGFSQVRLICDRRELDIRGISVAPLKMRFVDQVADTNSTAADGKGSFWKDLVQETRQTKTPLPATAGWFETRSPYMHQSALYGIRFLSAAIEDRASAELSTYLDGIHCGHHGQNPPDRENIGRSIRTLEKSAQAAGLSFHTLGCSQSSSARGYCTWDDGMGRVISTCTERAFRIRDLSWLISRFSLPHPILSADCAILARKKVSAPLVDRAEKAGTAPPITILVTHKPYGTGDTAGAIAFAVAAAHAGILTRVVFIEDGIYALTGSQRVPEHSDRPTIQELISLVAGNENLHFFAFTPSFQKRSIQKDRSQNAVLDIGYPGLGKIFFYPPSNVQAEHQRIIIF
ncbi:MAG: sulfur oxidase [Methanomicrobiales archaeon]|nr:sulfur oxidase [Methanomicrobiales archaeon]